MTRRADPRIAEMNGAAALPRKSGELVFHDPWERQVFVLAVALCEQGLYQWDEFRDRLIAEIAAERAGSTENPSSPQPGYYEHWLAAFEKLVIEKGICTPEQLNALTAEL
ncbi:MAG TPA: nitrile hydratase accessory protein [Candidatus Binatia bacterium]|jgi:nitrile hydratase|nr:nitrile hydratase accessory protein [Candidatus Binatia bacterium]